MRIIRGGEPQPKHEASPYVFAEQLVDHTDQLETYDRAKWNLLGHANRNMRFAGHHPWPKRTDREGVERTLSVPVFSGYSAETQTVMMIRKDPWTHQNDPRSWLVAEQNLATGNYIEPEILSAKVTGGRQLWLQLAPQGYSNWPPGLHPALFARPYDQIRIEGRLDERYHLETAEYRHGRNGSGIKYEDIEALESMIIAVQQTRWAAECEHLERQHQQEMVASMGLRAVASLDGLPAAG